MSVPAAANATASPVQVAGRDVASGVIAASAARTATMTGATMTNPGHTGVIVVIKTTAHASTPAATAVIQGYDPGSASWYDILTSIATLGNSEATTILTVLPCATAEANVTINKGIPAQWRVVFTPTDADSCTYSIGYSYIG